MKKIPVKILYRLFTFLSDKTNGFAPFVKYKLILGALLVGFSACSNPPEEIMCYDPAFPPEISDSTAVTKKNINNFEKEFIGKTIRKETKHVEENEH